MKITIPDMPKLPRLPGLSGKASFAAASAAVVLAGAASSVTVIQPGQFGMQETLSNVTSAHMNPGVHLQFPLLQFTHVYRANTQHIAFSAAGARWHPFEPSTADRNPVIMDLMLNYRVLPDENKLIYHRWAMRRWLNTENGYFLLTQMMNDSTNAVLGRQTLGGTLTNHAQFQKDLYADLKLRLEQNNVPVEIESLELKSIRTFMPTRTVSYEVQGPAVKYNGPR